MTGTLWRGVAFASTACLSSADNTDHIIHGFKESLHVWQGLTCYSEGDEGMEHCYKHGVSLMEYLDRKLSKRPTVC